MDPNAPHYDRPPDRRKRRRQGLFAQFGGPQDGRPASGPPKGEPGYVPTDQRRPPMTAGPLMRTGSAAAVGAPKSTMPRHGSLGNISAFKQGVNAGGQAGKQIGFYNATHQHGEPMKGLLAALKARRGQGQTGPRRKPSAQTSYEPNA